MLVYFPDSICVDFDYQAVGRTQPWLLAVVAGWVAVLALQLVAALPLPLPGQAAVHHQAAFLQVVVPLRQSQAAAHPAMVLLHLFQAVVHQAEVPQRHPIHQGLPLLQPLL